MFHKMKAGQTSNMIPVRVYDSSSTTGGYLSGLTSASSGLTGRYRRAGSSAWTAITIVSATAGTFTSGGFAVPTSGPSGSYEIHVPDAAFASGARWVEIEYSGVTNMLPVQLLIELDAVDYQDATAFGLSRLDAAVTSRMASYPQPTGFLAATFPSTVASPTNITSATGIQLAANQDVRNVTGTISDKTGYSLSQSFPSNFASLAITAGGAVTVGTNSDKTGYSLSQTFPSNFSSLAITAAGKVTVGTNDDKTGYALTQSFPSNFASLGINASGHISRVTTVDTTTTNSDMLTANAIADAVLSRNVSNVESSAGEHTLCTIVLASLESSISGTSWTIKRTNGTTTHATKTITTNASADPITGVS